MLNGETFDKAVAKALQKPRPRALEKEDKDALWKKLDDSESKKVKARSRGQCEVIVNGRRCVRRAFEVHHHIGGWKIRGRGPSALAKNKSHCCSDCHGRITANILEHIEGNRYKEIR